MTPIPQPAAVNLPAKLPPKAVDLLLALSFANLVFYRVWQSYLSSENDYFGATVPRLSLGGVVADVLLVAGAAFALLRFAGRARGRAARLLDWLLFALAVLFGPQRLYLIQFLDGRLNALGTLAYLALAALAAISFALWPAKMKRLAAATLLILSPFLLFTLPQAAWRIASPTPRTMRSKPPAPRLSVNPSRRVVLIVFDEMDYVVAFDQRPPDLQLPHFDRLRSESWFATNALPPADGTLISMPAIITGLPIVAARPITGNDIELELRHENEPPPLPWVRLSRQATVFGDARSQNLNTAAIGWFHPYCRAFGDQLVACAEGGERGDELGPCADCAPSLAHAMGDAALRVLPFRTPRMSAYRERWWQQVSIQRLRRLHSAGLSAVSDPDLGFVLLHLPVPHNPFLYSRQEQGFIRYRGTYPDNLALADRLWAELRNAMEQSGTWDNTTVIVTADHWWRYGLYAARDQLNGEAPVYGRRVPFIVHLPGSRTETTYEPPINNRLLRAATLALLDHPQWSAADFSAWMDANRGQYRPDFIAHMYVY